MGDVNNTGEMQSIIRQVVDEFVNREQAKKEPAYKLELEEERRRREQLERRVNELVEENTRSRKATEELERASTIRTELQRLGVAKVDLAFKTIRDDVVRAEDGRLVARGEQGDVGLREFVTSFVAENPEFLPARISGGSGLMPGQKTPGPSGSVDLEKIRPGMSKEEMERVRQEIVRVASQTLKGM